MQSLEAFTTKTVHYREYPIRVIKYPSTGKVYFCVRDILSALGITNYNRILARVSSNHKIIAKLYTPTHRYPQRYWMVDKYGVASIVYRTTRSKVDPNEFFIWAEEISQKDTLS